jgi:hypothetical protein
MQAQFSSAETETHHIRRVLGMKLSVFAMYGELMNFKIAYIPHISRGEWELCVFAESRVCYSIVSANLNLYSKLL